MSLWIGTSGFQYPEWKPAFYPADLPTKRMLPFYAQQFSTTEINYTFRRIPSESTLLNWKEATPATFKFSFKAPQRITHFARLRDCGPIFNDFINAISEMKTKLGPVLLQLPPNFQKDLARLGAFLEEVSSSVRIAFEFRHASWFDDEIFSILAQHKAALCVAESEDLATPPTSTTSFGYLRLRREDYTRKDIERWAEFIQGQSKWRETFIYFKHEEKALGPQFARQMIDSLEKKSAIAKRGMRS